MIAWLILVIAFFIFGGFCFWFGWDTRADYEWNKKYLPPDPDPPLLDRIARRMAEHDQHQPYTGE